MSTRRGIITGLIMLVAVASALPPNAFLTQWKAANSAAAPANPMTAYSDSSNIIGFWHSKNSGGLGIQLNNTSVASNVWVDISGAGRDIALSSFGWTSASGWADDGALVFNGSAGNASGTIAGLASNFTFMAIFKPAASTLGVVLEMSTNHGFNLGAWVCAINEVNANSVESALKNSTSYFYTMSRSAAGVITNGVYFIQQAAFQTQDADSVFMTHYKDDTEIALDVDVRTPVALYNGAFYVGSRASSTLRINGSLKMLAIWKTTLTPAQIAHNAEIARSQFGL